VALPARRSEQQPVPLDERPEAQATSAELAVVSRSAAVERQAAWRQVALRWIRRPVRRSLGLRLAKLELQGLPRRSVDI
jgi:hypothetical protein